MPDPRDRVREILAAAVSLSPPAAEAVPAGPQPDPFASTGDAPPWEGVDANAEPSALDRDPVDPDIVAGCAGLDQSDTDNGSRLIRHFGADLLVLETEGAPSADYGVWAQTHWDFASGNDASIRVAQRIGGRIGLEADHLALSAPERDLLRRAEALRPRDPATLTDAERQTLTDAKGVPAALAGRKRSRRAFGVSSKNQGRIVNMLRMAAPHLTRKPEAFNGDPHRVATLHHTLRFRREVAVRRALDLECPDPAVERWIETREVSAALDAAPGHERAHLITKLMPVAWDPAATCPRWDAFLDEFLPDATVRRMVQVFSGLGLTGIGLQRVMFHYGSGANGKSVFMETLMRLSGPLGVGLPAASLVGENRATGQQASPDIARLYGARIVRVAELPPGEPVKEELVKLLTGGEAMPVRNLFKGFFEFTPVFKAHMSGNGYPRIDGTDNGIWRRMVVVPWVKTIPEARRRDLHDVVAEFVVEGSGILNWMIEGVLIFLREGFVVPDAAAIATKAYRDEMDPIGQFATACVRSEPGSKVQASTMYRAYETWCLANGKAPYKQTMFGRHMKNKVPRDDSGSVHYYTDCILHDVPERPQAEPSDRLAL